MVPRVRTFLLILCLLMTGASAAMPSESSPRPYLALGDSVVFGFITQAGFEYGNPTNFIGFPDYVGRDLRLNDVNAACPGETTGSFLSATATDHGCRQFRSLAPLHVSYGSTQSSFALSFLAKHRSTRLVTILLGANDLFVLEDACAGDATCIANGLPAVLATISTNMATILGEIRGTGFKGAIVVENYYSLDYSDAAGNRSDSTPESGDRGADDIFRGGRGRRVHRLSTCCHEPVCRRPDLQSRIAECIAAEPVRL